MASYSIFALEESQLTVSGGGQLDGVTQGDGSHLVGLEITLNANAWTEVAISDDDTDFRDNDSSQRLDGAQSFDGTTYASGTMVEAEYGLTLTDGTNTWQVVGFNIVNSSPSYGTVEGLAFVGGPGGFPPVGVPLTVISAQEGPNFQAAAYATPACFLAGTLIDTPAGRCPIETLCVGDLVNTQDHGPQVVRWTGSRPAIATGRFAPVTIAAGTLGAIAPLQVSQQHRMLIRSARAELLFGAAEVFVPAAHLTDGARICLSPGGVVTYLHLLLDRHEVIFANGVACESLHNVSGGHLSFFKDTPRICGPLARPALRHHEVRLIRNAEQDTRELLPVG